MPAVNRWRKGMVVQPAGEMKHPGQTDRSGQPPVARHFLPQCDKGRDAREELSVFEYMQPSGGRISIEVPLRQAGGIVQVIETYRQGVVPAVCRVVIDLVAADRAVCIVENGCRAVVRLCHS